MMAMADIIQNHYVITVIAGYAVAAFGLGWLIWQAGKDSKK